ncbi:MAG: hypothetical protein ACTSW1_09435, partial [Candidatus Hodarchaeales archaeon]
MILASNLARIISIYLLLISPFLGVQYGPTNTTSYSEINQFNEKSIGSVNKVPDLKASEINNTLIGLTPEYEISIYIFKDEWGLVSTNRYPIGAPVQFHLSVRFLGGEEVQTIAEDLIISIYDENDIKIWNYSVGFLYHGYYGKRIIWPQVDLENKIICPSNYSLGIEYINPYHQDLIDLIDVLEFEIFDVTENGFVGWTSAVPLSNLSETFSFQPIWDLEGNIHLIFDNYSSTTSIYYIKLNSHGNIITDMKFLEYGCRPRAAIDSLNNIHILFSYSSSLKYMKIDTDGNNLNKTKVIYENFDSLSTITATISQDQTIEVSISSSSSGFSLIILDLNGNFISNGILEESWIHGSNLLTSDYSQVFVYEKSSSIFFSKYDQSGNILINDKYLFNIVGNLYYVIHISEDSEGNFNLIWSNGTINYCKLDSVGEILLEPRKVIEDPIESIPVRYFSILLDDDNILSII